MGSIQVDIDELLGKLDEIKNDDYVTVQLEICEDDEDSAFGKELVVSAVSFEDKESVGYGSISESNGELL